LVVVKDVDRHTSEEAILVEFVETIVGVSTKPYAVEGLSTSQDDRNALQQITWTTFTQPRGAVFSKHPI